MARGRKHKRLIGRLIHWSGRLRRKLEVDRKPELIKTVWGWWLYVPVLRLGMSTDFPSFWRRWLPQSITADLVAGTGRADSGAGMGYRFIVPNGMKRWGW